MTAIRAPAFLPSRAEGLLWQFLDILQILGPPAFEFVRFQIRKGDKRNRGETPILNQFAAGITSFEFHAGIRVKISIRIGSKPIRMICSFP